MVSPYYNYSMFCCGFPAIDVRGDKADWVRLKNSWTEIGKLFTKHQSYIGVIEVLLDEICKSLDNAGFWKKMFALDHCGSGHQYTEQQLVRLPLAALLSRHSCSQSGITHEISGLGVRVFVFIQVSV